MACLPQVARMLHHLLLSGLVVSAVYSLPLVHRLYLMQPRPSSSLPVTNLRQNSVVEVLWTKAPFLPFFLDQQFSYSLPSKQQPPLLTRWQQQVSASVRLNQPHGRSEQRIASCRVSLLRLVYVPVPGPALQFDDCH